MRKTFMILSVIIPLFFGFTLNTPIHMIGKEVHDFSLKNVDGKQIGFHSFPKAKGFIVVFTCNHCPFAKLYQDRINALNKMYAPKGYPVLAISANSPLLDEDDSYERMIERAKEKHYSFPYLYDEHQVVAKSFHAQKTPHAFVLQKVQNEFVIQYSGAIDDNGAEETEIKNHYVKMAVESLLKGESVKIKETKSIGCQIK